MVCLVAAAPLSAQTLEVTPFGGYRFGGDFFELLTGQPVDLDGAPAVGVVIDVPTGAGFQVEGLFTHQRARLVLPASPDKPPVPWELTVDHWLAGGLQEFDRGRVRRFLIGSLGLTRYAAREDSEIRFTLSGGGGVKLLPNSRLGVRLTGQAFATFADGDATAFLCGPAGCVVGLNVDVVWQIEFTAGVILRFP